MRITESRLRKIIREALLSELEGKAAEEWESAFRKADEMKPQKPVTAADMSKREEILARIDHGIEVLVGPELKMLDKFLAQLGL